jgi:peroxiredoxin
VNESVETNRLTAEQRLPQGVLRRLIPALVGLGLLAGAVFLVISLIEPNASPKPVNTEPDLANEARKDLERRHYRPLSGALEAMLNDRSYEPIPTQAHPLLGQTAPDFTLPDVDGKPWSLTQALKDGPVVLVFYYGYHCNHCVSQLFALHKDIEKFHELQAQVVAISADPAALTRKRFERYGGFAFPVLSDPSNNVAEKFGTYAPSLKAGDDGDLMHGTFIITRQGRVVWANRGDGPFTENRTLLMELHRSERATPR